MFFVSLYVIIDMWQRGELFVFLHFLDFEERGEIYMACCRKYTIYIQ